ncbi:MAG: oligoendopeptidase F [candidate division Zixibacteria bacterium]|nr:oligoendopeptidase F [candidate division Zixibacteria bacterium]
MRSAVTVSSRLVGLVLLGVILVFTSAYSQDSDIPQRSDIEAKYKWSLEDIYPDTITWQADFEYVSANLPRLSEFEGKLGQSAETLYDCLNLRDELSKKIGSMYVYAFMKYHEDTRISAYQQLQQRIAGLDAQADEFLSFVEPEILSIPDDKLKGFIKDNSKLKVYEFQINDLIRSKAHILSPEEEAILALAGPVTRGPENIYDMTYLADVKFPTVKDENGEDVQLTRGRFSRIMESTDRDYRRRAHKAYNETYEPYFNTLGATLASSVNGDWFYAQARNYSSCLEYKLDANNIPAVVYDNLVNAVNDNLEPLHKWVSLRKKVLKLDEIYPYDLSVPLVPAASKDVTYDEAMATTIKALKPMGKSYVKDIKDGFKNGWIDVHETEGKYTGGYCWGTYTSHPYILLNWNNRIQNMFTLAHEMGHALHRDLSYRNQPYSMAYYTTFVAEVASNVNEALLMHYLIDNAKTDEEKLYLLTHYIEEILGTFYFQVMFSDFEKAIHEVVETGGALSAESMKEIYTEQYKKYWGPELASVDWGGWGGLRVSHFYTSYYVYQYATSYAAAQDISQRILEGDTQLRDKFIEFLASGGNDYPVEQLKNIGVDMTEQEVINAAINLFSDLVDQAEELLLKSN